MRKLALALLIVALSAGAASAMDMAARTFYIHGIFVLPTGDFGDAAGNGFGGGVGIKVPHDDRLSFRGEVGYVMFGSKDIDGYDLDGDPVTYEYSSSMIPIIAMAEYQFNPDSPIYGLGGVGLHYWSTDISPSLPIDVDDSGTEFGLTLGGGFRINEQLSGEARYNIISDYNQFTINVVFQF
ncbi:porin family protein [bacterium]|nr:porin family protein [bacterium]